MPTVRVSSLPGVIDEDAPIFVISVAAQLAGMHAQTLRTYDRMGLVRPVRAAGRGRRYSRRDVARLRLIQRLSQDEGVNLEGIRRILTLEEENQTLRRRVDELQRLLSMTVEAASRVFTAEPSGAVHLGRTSRSGPPPRALTR